MGSKKALLVDLEDPQQLSRISSSQPPFPLLVTAGDLLHCLDNAQDVVDAFPHAHWLVLEPYLTSKTSLWYRQLAQAGSTPLLIHEVEALFAGRETLHMKRVADHMLFIFSPKGEPK
jgi:hypothetical protein